MIRAIIIDDEIHCIETLKTLVQEFCGEVEIVETCNSAIQGRSVIDRHQPDLVFLDIEMPGMSGFDLLEHYSPVPFTVIFTTSYDQYAIRAIRFSALDYLLKPVDRRELVNAVNKAITLHGQFAANPAKVLQQAAERFNMLFDQLRMPGQAFAGIAIPTAQGFEMVPAGSILKCEANDNYTFIFLKNKTRMIASRTLKEIGEQLQNHTQFVRVHNSFIINLNEVTKYVKGEGGYVIMSDGTTVNVSRSRKDALLRYFS